MATFHATSGEIAVVIRGGTYSACRELILLSRRETREEGSDEECRLHDEQIANRADSDIFVEEQDRIAIAKDGRESLGFCMLQNKVVENISVRSFGVVGRSPSCRATVNYKANPGNPWIMGLKRAIPQ